MTQETGDLLGRVVVSKAGRDKSRAFLVIGSADEGHVLLADGCLRRFDRPKKKKIKHVRVELAAAEGIKAKLLSKEQVLDAEIRNCLLDLGYKLE